MLLANTDGLFTWSHVYEPREAWSADRSGGGAGRGAEGRGWPADAARGPPDDVTRRTARPAAGYRPQGTGVTSRTLNRPRL